MHTRESIVELVHDIGDLIRPAYQLSTADVKEQFSNECFIDALNDHEFEWVDLKGKP